MDSNLKSYPILSYVLGRLPSVGPKTSGSTDADYDVEQPPPPQSQPDPSNSEPFIDPLVEQMPHLKDPKVIAEMTAAVSEIAQTRSVLAALGERPDHETVDRAKAKVAEIESSLSNQLEAVVLITRLPEFDQNDWKAHLADKEKEKRNAAEKEKQMYKTIIQLDEMHEAYQKLLKDAEVKLMKIYDTAAELDGKEKDEAVSGEAGGETPGISEEVNEEVIGILQQNATGNGVEKVDLSGRRLRLLPEAFGKIRGLLALYLSNNQLQALPDSIAGLELLEVLNISSNLLENLPDSIGLLHNLKFLNVSSNKLTALPDSISYCKSLIELDASFNNLTYIPTNIGHEMRNLRKLSIQYNKIRHLPTSVGDMESLQHLDVHFNELHGLPLSIGKLGNLETLNLSGNFSDMTELPETFGELMKLRELNLSNNQIHELPITFGRLQNLVELNLEHNPIVIPPVEVVNQGVEAVKVYMAQRWCDILLEEEERSMLEKKEETETGWLKRSLSRSTSWLKEHVSTVSDYLVYPRGSPRDPCLDQQL